MKYKLIKNIKELQDCIRELQFAKILACDTETSNLSERVGKLRLIQLNDGKQTYLIDCFAFDNYDQIKILNPILEDRNIRKIFHNYKFDYKWLWKFLGIEVQPVFDTQIASILVDFNIEKGYHKLSSLSKRYLNVDLDKTEQNSDWSGVLTSSQFEYAALDVEYLHTLREKLLEKLNHSNQLAVAKIEFDCIAAVADMEMAGMPFNRDLHEKLIVQIEKERDEQQVILKTYLEGEKTVRLIQEDLFGEEFELATEQDINLNSVPQIKAAFNRKGIPLTSTDKKILEPLALEYPDLKYLINYRKAEKLCTTYGRSFLDYVQQCGRIYGDFLQLGAITCRFASRNPNLQNLPREKRFREIFSVGEGRSLVIADFSQIELRILAEFSGDKNMSQVYNDDLDIHSFTTSKIFGVPYEETTTIYAEKRVQAKTANFSIVYGISPKALKARIEAQTKKEMAIEEAKSIIDGFYQSYPEARSWLYSQERIPLKTNLLICPTGKQIKLDFDRKDERSLAGAQRDCRNFPIQNLSAYITKRALIRLRQELTVYDAKVVNVVHDEIIVECAENIAEEIKPILERCMRLAGEEYLKKIKVKADAKIGKSWGEK